MCVQATGVVKQAIKEGFKNVGLPSLCFGGECCFLIQAAPVLDVCIGAKLCTPPISFGSFDGLSNICIGSTPANPASTQTCAPVADVITEFTTFQLRDVGTCNLLHVFCAFILGVMTRSQSAWSSLIVKLVASITLLCA